MGQRINKKDLDVHPKKKTDVKFCLSDTLSDKTSLLNLSASLKASFMSGLVEVGGSAKYLNDKKTSSHQSRVIMQYSQTTTFKQLTMSHLGAIAYPQVFEENLATHVIIAVLYGAHAFLVFDHTATKYEDAQEIHGNLSAMVRNISHFSIEGKGNIMMNEKEKKLAEEITCTFHGDYEIEENPTTFMDALQLYKKLPSLLKDRETHAVPVKVWLYPLAQLDTKAARLEREIGVILIAKMENLLEELEHGERTCNDLVQNATVCEFQDVMERLKLFKGFLRDYKMLFLKAMRRLLPAIRGGEEKDQALSDVLHAHGQSLFTVTRQNKWLENIQSEVNMLDSYNRELKGTVVTSSDLEQIVFNPSVDIVICFSFTSLKYEDQYLSSLAECIREDEFEKLSAHPKSKDLDLPAWFNNPDISERMKENFSLFKHFSEANKENDKIRCVTAAVSDPSNPGTSIRLYRNGKMVDSKFQPVSKPPAPTVHIQNGNMVLKLQKSPTGVTMQYRVEYRADSGDDDTWKVIDTPDAQETFTLTGLQLARKYWVRYRVVSEVGVSEASDTIAFFQEGNVNVPVAKSWNWTILSFFNELRKMMTSSGISYWSQSTIQSEVRILFNMNTTHTGQIPGGLKPGQALFFQGVAPSDCKGFVINLKTGPKDDVDIVFHFDNRMTYVVCNSFRNGEWETESNTDWCPFTKGGAFDVFMVITPEEYEVIVNGQMFCTFNHRMPLEMVSTLEIWRDVFMDTVGIIEDWSTSTFSKELSLGTSRGKISNIQSDVDYTVCNSCKTYTGQILGGLKPGQALFFQGVVPTDCNRFSINLKTGPKDDDDIAFHFESCMTYVVCNSFRNGKWETESNTDWCPFAKGGAFDVFMVITPEKYEVIVNGQMFCTFNHRMPLERVSALEIREDVLMNTFRIIEVDNINLKVTIPPHV